MHLFNIRKEARHPAFYINFTLCQLLKHPFNTIITIDAHPFKTKSKIII